MQGGKKGSNRSRCLVALFCALAAGVTLAGFEPVTDWSELYHAGIKARALGNNRLALDLLGRSVATATGDAQRSASRQEFAATLIREKRLDEARAILEELRKVTTGVTRAKVELDLGNLAAARAQDAAAAEYYVEAERLAAQHPVVALSAALNRIRLMPEAARVAALQRAMTRIAEVDSAADRGRLYLNVATQASRPGAGHSLRLAYEAAREANVLAAELDARTRLEALDALSQLYEEDKRPADTLRLFSRGFGSEDAIHADLLARLHWRQAKALAALGREEEAAVSYHRAVEYLESIRADLPIELEDGTSTFRSLLRPLFMGYADLELKRAGAKPEAERSAALREAIRAMELTKQSEMQDYLGDRCSVETAAGSASLPRGSAALYTILLEDRIELLLDTGDSITRKTVPVPSRAVSEVAGQLAKDLTKYWSADYLRGAKQLYDWLVRPVEKELEGRAIDTVVLVPDGPLRLVPLAVLHDGEHFLIERFAVATVTGLSMTETRSAPRGRPAALLAGLSEPGPVVAKLPPPAEGGGRTRSAPAGVKVLAASQIRTMQVQRDGVVRGAAPEADPYAQLRRDLALPGVKKEIDTLRTLVPGTAIMDGNFTVTRFSDEAGSGDFRIVHIASHGVFGGNAASSYIMAYDDVVTMSRLDSLLRNTDVDSHPIELLTLSACETAEGNERAPLGISGVAIKAKAKSVLGTLWPVSDDAAQKAMQIFYTALLQDNASKAQALRTAQRELLKNETSAHPFFWAPFVLIGNWN